MGDLLDETELSAGAVTRPRRKKGRALPPALSGLPRKKLEALLAINPNLRPAAEHAIRCGAMTDIEAERVGDVVTATIRGLRLEITMNNVLSLGWRKVRAMRRQEHEAVGSALRGIEPPPPPWLAAIVRRGPVKMDPDNLVGTVKGTQDEIARWAGVDDGSPLWHWQWTDEVSDGYSVEIRIEGRWGLARGEPVVTDGVTNGEGQRSERAREAKAG